MDTNNKFTVLHRILHWTGALAMSVLFITGFLRMYWMNKNSITEIMQSKTTAIPTKEMTEIAVSIREPMWQWHEIFAYVMIATFSIRIIYMLVKGIRFPNPFKHSQPLKERLQGFTYVYFYVFVFMSAVTGICIQNGFFPAWKEGIETVHKWGIYWFPIFILLHFAGIFIAEISNKRGITSKMIGG